MVHLMRVYILDKRNYFDQPKSLNTRHASLFSMFPFSVALDMLMLSYSVKFMKNKFLRNLWLIRFFLATTSGHHGNGYSGYGLRWDLGGIKYLEDIGSRTQAIRRRTNKPYRNLISCRYNYFSSFGFGLIYELTTIVFHSSRAHFINTKTHLANIPSTWSTFFDLFSTKQNR